MSYTNSPADRLSEEELRIMADQWDDEAATPVERAIGKIGPHDMSPVVARRIIESLAASMSRSIWAPSLQDAINMLCDIESDLWGLRDE